jgi:signal peptidase II
MNPAHWLLRTQNRRIAALAMLVLALDQITKAIVLHLLPMVGNEKIVIDGFFKFVHWQNTGAAWSLFHDKNGLLAIVAAVALVVLYYSRHHFEMHTCLGQIAFGLIIGGILGNLVDRIRVHHVIDFVYFYLQTRNGREIGFPAFNVADTAICTGVGLIFLITLRNGHSPKSTESPESK